MSSSQIRSDINVLEKKSADLEKQRGQHLDKANKAASAASAKLVQAARTSSASSRSSYLRAADAESKKQVDESKKAADLTGKLADVNKRIADKQKSLTSALATERGKQERDDKARQRQADTYADRRRRIEKEHAREIARISQPQVRHIIVEAPKPEKLRVLYLTANGEVAQPLRVDAEVNNVLKSIRGAKYGALMDLQIRPAATPQDLIDGINDVRPHVVHFSGHGGSGLLAFDNASLDDPQSEVMEFDVLAELLSATSTPPKLLVMNACQTLQGSEVLLEAVPVLVAMADSVGDAGAGVFAMHFYAAIASAQPVGHALRQSKAMMKQALMRDDAELPQIASRADVNPDEMILIQGI